MEPASDLAELPSDPPASPPENPAATRAAAGSYVPSGRIDVGPFAGLALAALLVAGGMALGLSFAVRALPEFFGLVAMMGLAVLGTVGAAVYVGRCRNVPLAVTLAVLAMTIYYLGAWAIAYHETVGTARPVLAQRITAHTGLPAPLGYFVLRCDPTFGSFVHPGWAALKATEHALELALCVAAGIFLARRLAGRVYYEAHGRWAASWAFALAPADRPLVEAALAERDWAALATVEKATITRELRRRGANVFRVEYLPGAADQAAYVTVEAPRFARLGTAALVYVPLLHRFTRAVFRQRLVAPDEVPQLARHLPGFGLGHAGTTPAPSTPGQLQYWSGATSTDGHPVAPPSVQDTGLVSVLREVGFAGVTLVGRGEDFRTAASRASLAVSFGAPTVDPDAVDASLCLPVAAAPQLGVLKAFAWFELGLVYAFLALMMSAAVCMTVVPLLLGARFPWLALGATSFSALLMAAGWLVGLFLFLGYRRTQMALLARYIRRRGGSIIPPGTPARRELIRIEDAATFHIGKVTPEDIGIGVLDPARRRLLIEGVTHRYVIRDTDVLRIAPMTGNSASARITYRVGDTTLALVVNVYRPWVFWIGVVASLPLLGLPLRPISHRIPVRWARRLEAVLAPAPFASQN